MRRLLNLAVQWQMLDKNTLTNIPLMKVDNQVGRYLSDEEAKRLVQVLTTDLAYGASYLLLFLLSTGARLNEAMQVKWTQIDLDTGGGAFRPARARARGHGQCRSTIRPCGSWSSYGLGRGIPICLPTSPRRGRL